MTAYGLFGKVERRVQSGENARHDGANRVTVRDGRHDHGQVLPARGVRNSSQPHAPRTINTDGHIPRRWFAQHIWKPAVTQPTTPLQPLSPARVIAVRPPNVRFFGSGGHGSTQVRPRTADEQFDSRMPDISAEVRPVGYTERTTRHTFETATPPSFEAETIKRRCHVTSARTAAPQLASRRNRTVSTQYEQADDAAAPRP